MDQKPRPKFVPIRVYIDSVMHRRLKAKLALGGLSLSEWFRRKAQEEIDKN